MREHPDRLSTKSAPNACDGVTKPSATGTAVVRVALIYNPDNPNSVHYRRISEGASARLAIETVDHPIHGLADIDRAVASLADRGNRGALDRADVDEQLRTDRIPFCHLFVLYKEGPNLLRIHTKVPRGSLYCRMPSQAVVVAPHPAPA